MSNKRPLGGELRYVYRTGPARQPYRTRLTCRNLETLMLSGPQERDSSSDFRCLLHGAATVGVAFASLLDFWSTHRPPMRWPVCQRERGQALASDWATIGADLAVVLRSQPAPSEPEQTARAGR